MLPATYLEGLAALPNLGRNLPREQRAAAQHAGQSLVELVNTEPAGYWRDVITRRDGSVEVLPWQHNLVVNAFANLVAALCAGNGAGGVGTTYAGVQYMAVGTGLSSWDTGGTPAPNLTDTLLVTELARKIVTAQFVDGTGAVVAGPTNSILITATFNTGEANGTLREWGLFGGNATSVANSGIMVDHVTTPSLNKPSGINDFSLTRLVTLIF